MPVRHARSETRGRPPFGPIGWSWQERFDKFPQRIWKQRGGHTCSRYVADVGEVLEVLLRALRTDRVGHELLRGRSTLLVVERHSVPRGVLPGQLHFEVLNQCIPRLASSQPTANTGHTETYRFSKPVSSLYLSR